MDARRQEILTKAKSVDTGKGVLLLTDMFGGTPSNLAMSVIGHGNFDLVAGVNLPMLIKLGEARKNMEVAACAECAQEAGKKYINVASQLLNGAPK
jgi:PTS system mannose-specific IIA component